MKKQYSNLLNTTFTLKDRATLSVSALQKNLLHSSKQKRRFEDKLNDKLPTSTITTTDFKIVSPFYDRNKVCKISNCFCPFHKRLREQASRKYQIRARKVFNSTMNSPKKEGEGRQGLQHERLSHKIQPKNKENNSLERGDMESRNLHRNKLNSFNFEFDLFLKYANQVLLDKLNHGKVNEHVIKSSVGEIFKYIYENLDKDRAEVSEYILGIQKDRDLTNFYIDRYEDLKRRRTANERNKTFKKTVYKDIRDAHSRATSKAVTRNFERQPTVARKTNREKTQKLLLIEKLIRCVKDGIEVDEDQVKDIAILNIEPFQENCNHLKKKIAVFDLDTLQSVKQDIVEQLQRKLIASKTDPQVAQQDHEKKREIVRNLLSSITQRIEQLNKEQQSEYEKEKYDRVGSSYSKSSLTKKGSGNYQGKKKNSKFFDVDRKNLLDDENMDIAGSQSSEGSEQSPRQSNRESGGLAVHNSSRNFRPQQGNDNQDDQLAGIPQALKKQGKLKLAKYRRLSHQGFFQKRFSQGEDGSFIPKIHIERFQDIGPSLDALAIQFGQKWKKIKDMERKISDLKMKKYIIHENDDLITAKRKIHMLKTLLKEQVFEGSLKEEIKEYINLVEQFNLLKNRTWAERRLKNMIRYNDDISISEINEEPTQQNFHKLIQGICRNKNHLLYYIVQVTQFQEKEMNLQGQLFDIIEKDLKMQKLRSKKSEKKKTNAIPVPTQKEEQEEDRQQGNFVQKGLSNHYNSQLCYDKSQNLLIKGTERQKEYTYNQKEASQIYSHFKYFNKIYFG